MTEKYPKASVVLTLGEKGAIYQMANKHILSQYFLSMLWIRQQLEIHLRGIIWQAVMSGEEIPKALKLAAKTSSIAVGREEAARSIPGMNELQD